MKKSRRIINIVISLIIFSLVILFPNYIYSMQTKEEIPTELIIGGELLQIHMDTTKVMFYTLNDSETKLKNYDLIEKIEGKVIEKIFNKKYIEDVTRKDIFFIYAQTNKLEKVKVTILRNNEHENLYLGKEDLNSSYFTEQIPFSASLTYIDPKNNSFGAIAHDVDMQNKKDIFKGKGNIYLCESVKINKSYENKLGNIYGEQILSSQGDINCVDEFGAKGKIKGSEILENSDVYKVGKRSEVKEGVAQLIIKENGNKKSYDINITKINNQQKPKTQGFEFMVEDEKFIKNYGGIVQGMSGCPIVQNGKIIGALSHVILSNPQKGLGVYIEWMIEQ